MKKAVRPHERRRGWLMNGNPPGDLGAVQRCGAKTRRGSECKCPAMANGRCRLHGGLSTGPKTADGIERIRRAVTKHGRHSEVTRKQRDKYRTLVRSAKELLSGFLTAETFGL
jgi:hypothetical protein